MNKKHVNKCCKCNCRIILAKPTEVAICRLCRADPDRIKGKIVEFKIPSYYKGNVLEYVDMQLNYLVDILNDKNKRININDQRILDLINLRYCISKRKDPYRVEPFTLVYRIYRPL